MKRERYLYIKWLGDDVMRFLGKYTLKVGFPVIIITEALDPPKRPQKDPQNTPKIGGILLRIPYTCNAQKSTRLPN